MPFFNVNGKNVLFIHVPKTGGTSVESWMSDHATVRFRSVGVPDALQCTPQHLRMTDFRKLFGDDFFDYAFMIVRNPYDRIVSEYRMRAAEAIQGFWGEAPTFSQWLESSLKLQQRDPWCLDNHLRPQWEFVGSGVDVFKFEDGLENIVRRVADRIGLAAPDALPRKMELGGSVGSVDWDHHDRILVRKQYDRDFLEFGYSH